MAKRQSTWFIALFFGLTALPTAAMLVGITLVKPIDENRRLARVPSWPGGDPGATPSQRVIAFSQSADAWFGDHFGFRSLLIRLKAQIDLSVFRTSDRVHIGADGWLFYRSVMDHEKLAAEENIKWHEDNIFAGLEGLNTALRRRGIHLVIVVNLLADRFYPDKLPSTVASLPSPPTIDGFLAHLYASKSLDSVDPAPILREEQQRYRPFYKTDFHWTSPGAFGVARELVARFARADGRASPWSHSLEIETAPFSGGIAMALPVFFPPVEDAPNVKIIWSDPVGTRHLPGHGIFERERRVDIPDKNLLSPITVLGDSFYDAIAVSGMERYFSAMYRIRWNPTMKISDVAAALPLDTRYFLLQFTEVDHQAFNAFADRADVALAVKRILDR